MKVLTYQTRPVEDLSLNRHQSNVVREIVGLEFTLGG